MKVGLDEGELETLLMALDWYLAGIMKDAVIRFRKDPFANPPGDAQYIIASAFALQRKLKEKRCEFQKSMEGKS